MSKEKETTINGIDVSECKYLNKVVNEEPYCNIDEEHLYTCSSDENCYFKQLKRLQEENEELKTYIQKMDKPEIKTIDSEIALKNIELQQENEKLKENQCCPETCEHIATEIIRYSNVCEVNSKYKQALEEIRDRLIVVTEEEPRSTKNLVLDLKPIIEGVLNGKD